MAREAADHGDTMKALCRKGPARRTTSTCGIPRPELTEGRVRWCQRAASVNALDCSHPVLLLEITGSHAAAR